MQINLAKVSIFIARLWMFKHYLRNPSSTKRLMKNMRYVIWLMCLQISVQAIAQTNSPQTTFNLEATKRYDPERVGGFVGAMTSCYNNYKSKNYADIYDATIPIINGMSPLDRNKAMVFYVRSVKTRILNSRKLSAAECERLVYSNWADYLNGP
jgi:hypothetical protein